MGSEDSDLLVKLGQADRDSEDADEQVERPREGDSDEEAVVGRARR